MIPGSPAGGMNGGAWPVLLSWVRLVDAITASTAPEIDCLRRITPSDSRRTSRNENAPVIQPGRSVPHDAGLARRAPAVRGDGKNIAHQVPSQASGSRCHSIVRPTGAGVFFYQLQ